MWNSGNVAREKRNCVRVPTPFVGRPREAATEELGLFPVAGSSHDRTITESSVFGCI